MRTVLRHLAPVCVSTAFVLGVWMVFTLPLAAVFLIDEAFVVSDYLKFIAYAAGIGLGVSSLILFPLSLLLERLVMRTGWWAGVPPLLFVLSAIVLAARCLLTARFLETLFGWAGLLFALALLLTLYWGVLWLVHLVVHVVGKFRQKRRVAPSPLPVNSRIPHTSS